MFINCKHCGSLVATDPATDLPPERCPRCRGVLRSPAPATPQVSVATLLKAPPAASVSDDTEASTTEASIDPDELPLPSASTPTDGTPEGPPASEVVETTEARADVEAAPEPAPQVQIDDIAPPAKMPAPAPTTTRSSPSFARRGAAGPRDPRTRRQQRILSAAVAALTLLLGLQIVLADRARLSADPDWRPTLTRLCGVLGCSLPPWHEPAALTVLARDVRPDAARPGQLIASATFRNDARWAQAWPRLRLTLSDIDGRAVGSRVFTVDEYLGAAPDAPTLAAGHTADVRLQLVEADARAVSFAFDFL